MSVTTKKTSGIYALSGNTTDIKPAIELLLRGKKMIRMAPTSRWNWKVNMETKDFGACQP